jgi:glyoxylase-like metal-dependent hydrolase (beta-lactamase superfamily II)
MKHDAAAWLPDQRDEFDEVVITPPTMVFARSAVIDMGSKTVTMSYHGLGHTDSDIAISVDGHDILFLGDLVEQGSPPVYADGYPMSWPATLRSGLGERHQLVVPGHGDVMDRAATMAQLEEIEQVAALARRCLHEGLPVSEAARLGPYPEEFMMPAMSRALETGL